MGKDHGAETERSTSIWKIADSVPALSAHVSTNVRQQNC